MKKKRLWIAVRVFAAVFAFWGWWGVLYPELTMTPDTYRIVYEDGASGEVADRDIYRTVLRTDRSRLRFCSRLFMNLTAVYEQERGVKDAGKDK